MSSRAQCPSTATTEHEWKSTSWSCPIWFDDPEIVVAEGKSVSTVISTLTVNDIVAVDRLMKLNSATLGFLPQAALCDYLSRGNVLGAWDDHERLVGYLLYGANRDSFRIAHLCVSKRNRGQGIARTLVEALKEKVTTQKTITLHCRRDFPANNLWPRLGFIPLWERPGRSRAGTPLTYWCLTLVPNDQLSLFQAAASADAIDVVIDAQIFFDLMDSDSNQAALSRSLVSDFLIDSISLCITDEILVEINRNDNPVKRQAGRDHSYNFRTVTHHTALYESAEGMLKTILPSNSERSLSDIRQLSKTAAAGVEYFVTRDRRLLRERERIADLISLHVLSPAELIVKVHELSDSHAYTPERVSGLSLEWRRLGSAEFSSLPFESFLVPSEGKGKFKGRLEHYLSNPSRYKCAVLHSEGQAVAIRILEYRSDQAIVIHLVRAVSTKDRRPFERFLLADSILRAVDSNIQMLEFRDLGTSLRLESDLGELGFTNNNGQYVRLCLSQYLTRDDILARVAALTPESLPAYQSMSDTDIQRYCSPVATPTDENYYLIPIRPGFALSLVDRQQSAGDLFGGKISVLLRWDHVYYRRNTHYNMLKTPGRILWYVSGDSHKQVVAISHLDAVETGPPRALFRKFRQRGILDWNQIYEMSEGNLDSEIMALTFSHTFPFRDPIALVALRSIYAEDRQKLVLQSPSKISPSTFQKLFRFGFSA